MLHSTAAAPRRRFTGPQRLIAGAALTALAAAGLVAAGATTASATTTDTVTSAAASWTVLDRWNNYVLYAPAGPPPFALNSASSVTPAFPAGCSLPPSTSSLATPLPEGCDLLLSGGAGGTYTASTGEVTDVELGGITWVSPHFPGGVAFTDVEFSIAGHVATVIADVSGDPAAVPTATDDVTIATFDLTGVSPTVTGSTVTYTNLVGVVSSTITSVIPSWTSPNYAGAATAPLTLSFTTATPKVTASIASASAASGLAVSVAGDGFRAVTSPGDAGVYVAIAPSGGMPDVSTQAGMASFVASAWITPAQLASGAFSTTLTVPTSSLDPSRKYSVYTWQAHAHSNTTQDTETPLAIDFAALATPPVVPTPVDAVAPVAATVTAKKVAFTAGKRPGFVVRVGAAADGSPFVGKIVVKRHGVVLAKVRVTAADHGKVRVKLAKRFVSSIKVNVKAKPSSSAFTMTTSKVTLKAR